MMYLKHRYGLGYEVLVKEVSDSLVWRHFCHLSLSDRVPGSTTLIKLTHKYGEGTVRALNDILVLKLKEGKVVRGKKLRLNTTVVETDIHHPTDTRLLTDGIRVITRVISRLKKVVPGIGSRFVKHTRKAKKIYLGLMKVMKGRTGKDNSTLKKTGDKLVKITEEVIADGTVRCLLEREIDEESPGFIGGENEIFLGIDEHSFRHQELVHTITEVKKRKVLGILKDDRIATLKRFLSKIPSDKVKEVCIDMKAGLQKAAEAVFTIRITHTFTP